MVLWEEQLEKNACCTLYNFVLREYTGVKFLSMSKDGSEICPSSDVTQSDSDEPDEITAMQ